MSKYDVYRLPLTQPNLAQAIAAYKSRHGRLPAGLIVHKSQIAAALLILGAGGARVLPVTGCNGCLSNEFWLGDASVKKEAISCLTCQ